MNSMETNNGINPEQRISGILDAVGKMQQLSDAEQYAEIVRRLDQQESNPEALQNTTDFILTLLQHHQDTLRRAAMDILTNRESYGMYETHRRGVAVFGMLMKCLYVDNREMESDMRRYTEAAETQPRTPVERLLLRMMVETQIMSHKLKEVLEALQATLSSSSAEELLSHLIKETEGLAQKLRQTNTNKDEKQG